jgi:hypothetical protein
VPGEFWIAERVGGETGPDCGEFVSTAASPESPYPLAPGQTPARYFQEGYDGEGKETLENLFCLRCNRELESRHKSVAVYMFAQTVGIKPRQKSNAQRICFCPQCSVSLAMGPPPEGALNIAAWNMIRDLVGSDPALNQAAWDDLRGVAGSLPAETEIEGRSARAVGYFEF